MSDKIKRFLEVYERYRQGEDKLALLNIYYIYKVDAFDAESEEITDNLPNHVYEQMVNAIRKELVPPSAKTEELSNILHNESDKVEKLIYYGILGTNDTREYNVGSSNYSKHLLQPWSIWLDYPELTEWDKDIIKRILRTKQQNGKTEAESRIEDYNKIIHICQERIRQLEYERKEKAKKDE